MRAAVLLILFCILACAGTADETRPDEEAARRLEIAGWQREFEASRWRYAHWFAYAEMVENHRAAAVAGIFTVAAKSEKVMRYHLGRRLKALGGERYATRQPEYAACYTTEAALSSALRLLAAPRTGGPPQAFAAVEEGLKEARLVHAVRPKVLEWLGERFRALQRNPARQGWWNMEYLLCSICGMPSDDLRQRICPACGAPAAEFLRLR